MPRFTNKQLEPIKEHMIGMRSEFKNLTGLDVDTMIMFVDDIGPREKFIHERIELKTLEDELRLGFAGTYINKVMTIEK